MQNKSKERSQKRFTSSNSSKDSEYIEQFLIEIERLGEKLDMSIIRKLLEDTGIKLDPNYGPFCINPKLGRFVVRGVASLEAQNKAKHIQGVRLFKDTKIYPI